MPAIRRVVIAPYSAAAMYHLVADIESYPDFLPWCKAATVWNDGEAVCGRLDIAYRGLATDFTTRNINTPTESISMRLVKGPLSALEGNWRFIAIEKNRARVEFDLVYRFENRLLQKIFASLFSFVFEKFIDNFMAQARAVYGEAGKGKIAVQLVDVADINAPLPTLIVPAGATVKDALAAAARAVPDATLSIYGKPCTLATTLEDGDRVEINAPLPEDPREKRRRRAQQ